jgi:lycopene cyclase domain-containing protein
MTYWALNAAFLAVAAVVALAAVLARRAPRWRAVGMTAIVVLALTAVFDNAMIGVGLVDYDRDLISGAFVGIAPLEDFAYALAAVVLLPSLWSLLGGRAKEPAGRAPASDGRAQSRPRPDPDA